jgi:hypothetical protein
MAGRYRRVVRLQSAYRTGRHTEIGFSNSTDYWPLTVVPSPSRSRRLSSTWLMVGALTLLGAVLALAVERGIPAW